jgi:hypothetical protein
VTDHLRRKGSLPKGEGLLSAAPLGAFLLLRLSMLMSGPSPCLIGTSRPARSPSPGTCKGRRVLSRRFSFILAPLTRTLHMLNSLVRLVPQRKMERLS